MVPPLAPLAVKVKLEPTGKLLGRRLPKVCALLGGTGATPVVASKVATRFEVLTLPALCRYKTTVTVSPRSMAPLVGPLSLVKTAPAGTMLINGAATTVV